MQNMDQVVANLTSENEALRQILQEAVTNAVNLKAFCIRLQKEFEKVHTQLVEKDKDISAMKATLETMMKEEEKVIEF